MTYTTDMLDNEILNMKSHGVDIDILSEKYDILILPENIESSKDINNIHDAGSAIWLSKFLKESEVRCANSADINIEVSTLERRSAEIWLGFIWILREVALPILISIIKEKFSNGKVIHAKLRLKWKNGNIQKLDWEGDSENLVEILKALQGSSSAENKNED